MIFRKKLEKIEIICGNSKKFNKVGKKLLFCQLFVHAPMRNELKYLTLKLKNFTLKLKGASLLLIILTILSIVCACPNEEWAEKLDTQLTGPEIESIIKEKSLKNSP